MRHKWLQGSSIVAASEKQGNAHKGGVAAQEA